jgi:hypothetical protein
MSSIDGSINAIPIRVLVEDGRLDDARALLADAGVAVGNA